MFIEYILWSLQYLQASIGMVTVIDIVKGCCTISDSTRCWIFWYSTAVTNLQIIIFLHRLLVFNALYYRYKVIVYSKWLLPKKYYFENKFVFLKSKFEMIYECHQPTFNFKKNDEITRTMIIEDDQSDFIPIEGHYRDQIQHYNWELD